MIQLVLQLNLSRTGLLFEPCALVMGALRQGLYYHPPGFLAQTW